MDNYKEFESKMLNIISKYSYSKFNVDIDSIFKDGFAEYNKYSKKCEDINRVNNIYYSCLLYYLCCYIDKKHYKIFLKNVKKYELYKYFYTKKEQRFCKRFPNLFLKVTFLKNKKPEFFLTKYHIFRNNKSQYYSKTYKNEGLKFLLSRKIFLDYVELVITTKCSLRCKNCANLMNLYDKPYDVESDLIERSIEKLFESVDKIKLFRILGGEPLLNPKLKHYLEIIPYEKVGKVVIVTNGTIAIKDKELIKIIKDNDVEVEISDYGKLSRKRDELIETLKKEQLDYRVRKEDMYWLDYGSVKKYNNKKLNKQFYNCDIRCKSILNGCLYYCPRASHGYDLGLIERKSSEYIDLINSSKRTIKRKIKKLYKRRRYIEACKYCKYGTDEAIKIEPAIQQK